MAKKKTSKKKVVEAVSQSTINMDTVFARTVDTVQAKLQKQGMLVGHNPDIHVLPMPSFAIRYLWRNEGLPLSCIYQVVGPQASYKSTFAAEMIRWHRLCGGGGLLCEAETKATPDLRNSIFNWDEHAVHIEDCASIEDWQSKITWYTKEFQRVLELKDGPGRTIPWCAVVDTLTGKASEKTLDNIRTRGHAAQHFAIEAGSIADFMRAHPQNLLGWPFTFVGVNHMKIAKDIQTGLVERNVPGGWALKFQCATIINMERMGKIKDFSTYKLADISMETLKNSYGPDGVRIRVPFKTWYQNDAPEGEEPVQRLHSRFEWWAASVSLIMDGLGMSKADAARMVPRMKAACDIKSVSAGSLGKQYYSNRLGVSKSDAMPAHDLGMMLEQRPDVLGDLYEVTGIQRRPFFKPGVDYMKQLEDYAYVAAQADAADDCLQRMRALQERLANVAPGSAEQLQTDATTGVPMYDPDSDEEYAGASEDDFE